MISFQYHKQGILTRFDAVFRESINRWQKNKNDLFSAACSGF
jgi:hypothetical protein